MDDKLRNLLGEVSDEDFDRWLEGYIMLHGVSSVVMADLEEDTAEMVIEIGDDSAGS